MKKLYWSIIISSLLINFCIKAQTFDLKNKKIGILISKKNLWIDNYQAKYWSSYLQINDSLDLSEENLRTAATIKLGQLLVNWFKEFLFASDVYFLNEGKKFEPIVKSYPFQNPPPNIISLDYIFCIDTLYFYSQKEKTVFAISNKLYTELQNKMIIKGKISFYTIEPFELIKENIYQINENQNFNYPIPTQSFQLKIEKLLSSWLNQILGNQ